MLGPLGCGHQLVELGCNRDRVHHDILCRTGVHHHATHAHQGLGGVERLVVELAQCLAVDRVAPGRAELLEVEKGSPVANLLVGNKGQLEGGMRNARILEETGSERAYLGDAGLVVCPQERGAVGAHDVLAHEAREVRHLLGRGLDGLAVHHASHKVSALVVHHVRAHAQRGGVGRGVEVRAQAEGGQTLGASGGGDGPQDVGVLVHAHVHATHGRELVCQEARHAVLQRTRGHLLLVVRVGGGINLHVAQEALENVAHAVFLSDCRVVARRVRAVLLTSRKSTPLRRGAPRVPGAAL